MLYKMAKLGAMCVAATLLSQTAVLANRADDTLRVAWDAQLTNADSYFNTSREGVLLSRMVWDQLIERDPETFEYRPALAKSWEWIDNVTLELVLQEGVTFHNGEAFDADDVEYTLNWVSNSDNKVLNQSIVSWISRVEKLGQFKVRIHLKQPFPAALEYLSGPLPIYPNEYYAKVGPDGMAQQPVGTGPYKVTALESGTSITLKKNDSYWAGSPKGQPKIGNVVVTFPPDKTTQMAEVMSGSLDWIWYVPADQTQNLASVPGVAVSSGETMRVGYMYFDAAGRAGKSPLQDVRVRQAIAHSINREEFVKAFFPPSASPLKAFCFPTQFGCYQGASQYDYDLEKARKLMVEAGYPDGFSTTLYAFRQPSSWSEALAGYMSAIGIKTSIQVLQYSAFRTKNHEGVTPISFGDWGSSSINDASAILGNFFTGSPDDFTADKELADWVRQAGANPDKAIRQDLYRKAIDRIMEKAYALPMNSFAVYYAYSDALNFTSYKDEIPRYYLYSWKN